MNRLKILLAAAAIAAGLAAPAQAEAISLGAVPGTEVWGLFANPERRLCGTSVVYPGGEMLLLVASADGGMTLGLVNPHWQLRDDASYDVVVTTDSRRWSLRSTARDPHMVESGRLLPAVVSDLSRTSVLRIEHRQGTLVGSYSMEGSTRAIRAAFACAERLFGADPAAPFDEPAGDHREPFATPAPTPPATTSADPFGPLPKLAM